VTHIDINQNVGGFEVSDTNPLQYFSFDLPEFASQLFFRVNKSGTRGTGMLTSNVRPDPCCPALQARRWAWHGMRFHL
jgi:hypothetical protein